MHLRPYLLLSLLLLPLLLWLVPIPAQAQEHAIVDLELLEQAALEEGGEDVLGTPGMLVAYLLLAGLGLVTAVRVARAAEQAEETAR